MSPRALSAWLFTRRRRLSGGLLLDSRQEEAFLESVTVIAAVAVLAALALASYRPAPFKAAMTEAANLMLVFRTEIAAELAVTGRLPASILPDRESGDFAGRYFSGMEWRDQEIVLPLEAGFSRQLETVAPADAMPPFALSFRIARSAELGRPLILCGLSAPPAGFLAAPARHTTVPASLLPFFCRA